MYYEIWWKTLLFAVFQSQWDWVLPNVVRLWPFGKTMGIKCFVTLTFLQGHRISGNKTDSLHTLDTMFSIKLKFSMNVIYVHTYTYTSMADQPQKKFTQMYHNGRKRIWLTKGNISHDNAAILKQRYRTMFSICLLISKHKTIKQFKASAH